MSDNAITLDAAATPFDWRRWTALLGGLAVFLFIYFAPPWGVAIDPGGKEFVLSPEGKAAIGLFLMAGIWWVFEVIPIGITAIAIGVFQALFLIRPAKDAFRDFMDPSVMFIFGSMVIGMAFTKTGLTKRIAYKMLAVVGENTRTILLGCLVVTAAAAPMSWRTPRSPPPCSPSCWPSYALYKEGEGPSRFGKGLFIGMAYAAGAGSIITLLGAARGPAAGGDVHRVHRPPDRLLRASPTTWASSAGAWSFIIWAYTCRRLQAGEGHHSRPARKGGDNCRAHWAR